MSYCPIYQVKANRGISYCRALLSDAHGGGVSRSAERAHCAWCGARRTGSGPAKKRTCDQVPKSQALNVGICHNRAKRSSPDLKRCAWSDGLWVVEFLRRNRYKHYNTKEVTCQYMHLILLNFFDLRSLRSLRATLARGRALRACWLRLRRRGGSAVAPPSLAALLAAQHSGACRTAPAAALAVAFAPARRAALRAAAFRRERLRAIKRRKGAADNRTFTQNGHFVQSLRAIYSRFSSRSRAYACAHNARAAFEQNVRFVQSFSTAR